MFIEEKESLIKEIEDLLSKLSNLYSLESEYKNIYNLLNELDKFNNIHDTELLSLSMNSINLYKNISECMRCLVSEDLYLDYKFNTVVKCLNNIKSVLSGKSNNVFIKEKGRLIIELNNMSDKLNRCNSVDEEYESILSLLNRIKTFTDSYVEEFRKLRIYPLRIYSKIDESLKLLDFKDITSEEKLDGIKDCLGNIKSILSKENKNMLTKEKYEELYKLLANGNEEENNEELFNSLIANNEINSEQYKEIKELIGNEVRAQKIRPYQVFGDKEILTLLYHKPKTIQQLEGLKGFPKDGARVIKYGDKIVSIFNEEFRNKAGSSFFNF